MISLSDAGPSERMLEELIEWLKIPSISSGGGDPADLVRAAEWAAAKVRDSGGSAEVIEGEVNPLVIGQLRAQRADAPVVMIYGHYDVQSAAPLELWTAPPFEPEIRGDRLYGRGTSDDKGNFYPLLYVACELARERALPVNVRILIEGEEESAGDSVNRWLEKDQDKTDCVIVFDSDMLDARTPALTLGVRGIVMMDVQVRTAKQDLHSGMYGGSILNATHVLLEMLAQVLPDRDGLVPSALRGGATEPTPEEIAAWADLPPGDEVLAEVGGKPLTESSGDLYYKRNWADASVDVHGIEAGDARQIRTMVPCTARAKVSVRLAPGQTTEAIAPEFKRLLQAGAPGGAEVDVSVLSTGEPAMFDPATPALTLAAEALEKVCGRPTALTRVGGSLPVLSAFADKGIPAIVSGFALAGDGIHGPDESFRLESLRLGEAAARELYSRLAEL
ncbi:MAG TPA: M20/M25/M40 family metallo-hydrolase [Actinomycetota bacterium]|nr:M20/M25/M40 family metallo-hydrolase [Actinomycetota bacterium]